jgi:hypothetical protein
MSLSFERKRSIVGAVNAKCRMPASSIVMKTVAPARPFQAAIISSALINELESKSLFRRDSQEIAAAPNPVAHSSVTQ